MSKTFKLETRKEKRNVVIIKNAPPSSSGQSFKSFFMNVGSLALRSLSE